MIIIGYYMVHKQYGLTDEFKNTKMVGGAIENEKPSCTRLFMSLKAWELIKEEMRLYANNYLLNLEDYMKSLKSAESADNW